MNSEYRLAVVGVGGIGAAACYWASQRIGAGVIGLEQFPLFHVRGASQDHSRILRRAQHQEPYATLAHAAYDCWDHLQSAAGEQLVIPTGGLVLEATSERQGLQTAGRDIAGYSAMMKVHGVQHEIWDAEQVQAHYPQFRLNGDEKALFQNDTSIVDAAKANAAHVRLARANGATIRDECPVLALRSVPDGVEVVTSDETYLVDAVIMASGAWTNELLPDTQWPLTITQEQVTYYSPPDPEQFAVDNFPIFMWHGRHNFYGFPIYGEPGTKLGQHLGGNETTARDRTFVPDDDRVKRQQQFLEEHVPGFVGPELYTKTCLYTLPPDQNFVLGPLPDQPRINVAVGAGHAFKFASLLGRILSEQALDGATSHPVEAFRTDRPALTDPSFVRAFHV